MKVLYSPGEQGLGLRYYYVAVVDEMFVGQARSESGDTYATIDLFYPEEDQSVVLKVAKKMEEWLLYPEVYIEQTDETVYVAVLFILKGVSAIFILEELLPEKLKYPLSQKLPFAERGELIITGEAEFEVGQVRTFIESVERNECFRLHIATRGDNNIELLWGVELEEFHKGLSPLGFM